MTRSRLASPLQPGCIVRARGGERAAMVCSTTLVLGEWVCSVDAPLDPLDPETSKGHSRLGEWNYYQHALERIGGSGVR